MPNQTKPSQDSPSVQTGARSSKKPPSRMDLVFLKDCEICNGNVKATKGSRLLVHGVEAERLIADGKAEIAK